MNIDTSTIEGFDALTAEEKVAKLLAVDITPDYSGYVKKDVFDKTASELARVKKENLDRLSEDEKQKKLAEEELNNLRARNEELEKASKVASYKAKYIAGGYSADLAEATAIALVNGDYEAVFENQAKFIAEHDKTVKANMLGGTPLPPAGGSTPSLTVDDIMKIKDTAERQKAIRENPALFGLG